MKPGNGGYSISAPRDLSRNKEKDEVEGWKYEVQSGKYEVSRFFYTLDFCWSSCKNTSVAISTIMLHQPPGVAAPLTGAFSLANSPLALPAEFNTSATRWHNQPLIVKSAIGEPMASGIFRPQRGRKIVGRGKSASALAAPAGT